MDRNRANRECADCSGVNRRDFIAATSAALAVSALPATWSTASAAPASKNGAAPLVKELYNSLSDEQKGVVALKFDDPLRSRINPNWKITKANVGGFFDKKQQDLIDRIFRQITSEDGYDRFQKQMVDDSGEGGFKQYAVALFGDPNEGPHQFELTGRHHTIRTDFGSVAGAAFGGPIVYGHSKKGNSPDNLFSYQTKQANKVFQALDQKQREQALLVKAPGETQVQIKADQFAGISCGELTGDQKKLVEETLTAIMRPYSAENVKEAWDVVKSSGGIEKVNIAFYRTGDLDKDEEWDVWRLEGPSLVCHFRGSPHVHAYINVAKK